MSNEEILSNLDNSTQERTWYKAFLVSLANNPVVTPACVAACITRQTAYNHRDSNPEFAKAWDEALDAGWDRAESEAYRRAVEGHNETVYSQGIPCGEKKIYSDRLLEVLLKGNRAKTYRETHAIEVSGKLQTENMNGLSTEQLTAIVQKGIESEKKLGEGGQGSGGNITTGGSEE